MQAAYQPVVGIEPVFWAQEGWRWGAFTDAESTLNATEQGVMLNIQPAAGGDYVGKVNGAIGLSYGGMAFDPSLYELQVKFRVLGENEANSFRVMLSEPGTPNTGDEFQYHFDDLQTYEENEWVTVTKSLDAYNGIYSNQAEPKLDGILDGFQLGTMWDSTAALNIEVASALLKPINPTASNVAYEFNANTARRAWKWGAFNEPNAAVNNGDTIDIFLEASDNGGMGTHWLKHDFDAETSELVVTAKLGADNLAQNFTVILKDDDGLDGILNWEGINPRLDTSAEEWQFTFSTADFTEDEFVELRLPFYDDNGNPTNSWRQKAGDEVNFDGDLEMNFGNYLISIMRTWGNFDPLNIELKSIRIETAMSNPCDLNGDGDCNAADIDALTVATLAGSPDPKYDLDGNGTLNADDRTVMVEDLLYTYYGDANLDGEFNSNDFVEVFVAGQYEDTVVGNSGWATGDWNGDLEFDTNDFVTAFVAGGYELGPRQAVSAVPEPSSIVLLSLALLGLVSRCRTRQ